MNSLFYLAMLIGVGWLMVWVILPPEQRGKGWWPFDMRGEETQQAPLGAASGSEQRSHTGSRRNQANRETGPAAETEASKTEAAASAAPVSWRARRDKALSSRHGA